MWSGPRNVSTALMYSFAQRPDTTVLDEPLYGHYLRTSGVLHPGREEVLESMTRPGSEVALEMCQSDFGNPVLFIKSMAHHLVDLDLSFLDELHNILLIRDPRETLPSIVKQFPNPSLRDTGLKRQWELYQMLRDEGDNPIILDSREFLSNPESMLVKVCHLVDIPYYKEMLSWEEGPIKEDGVWAKHWYHNIHKSTGFKPYTPKNEPVPEHLIDLLEECDQYYQKLYKHSLKLTD